MGENTVTITASDYFDLVTRAASWNTIVKTVKEKGSVSPEIIMMLEGENTKKKEK